MDGKAMPSATSLVGLRHSLIRVTERRREHGHTTPHSQPGRYAQARDDPPGWAPCRTEGLGIRIMPSGARHCFIHPGTGPGNPEDLRRCRLADQRRACRAPVACATGGRTHDGRTLRMPNALDELIRENLTIQVRRKPSPTDMLTDLFILRGVPGLAPLRQRTGVRRRSIGGPPRLAPGPPSSSRTYPGRTAASRASTPGRNEKILCILKEARVGIAA